MTGWVMKIAFSMDSRRIGTGRDKLSSPADVGVGGEKAFPKAYGPSPTLAASVTGAFVIGSV